MNLPTVKAGCRSSLGTLRSWRSMRVGPSFVRIGKAVLYPIAELDVWDEQNCAACHASKRLIESLGDRR
ncbi:DNA-binding protein [Mesorhizobium dulcispinae]|uniref:DNA-binding protein n=1 Tax=Mesorhizobium dulcispinae TaxID=3072316 RepID=UPI003D315EB9